MKHQRLVIGLSMMIAGLAILVSVLGLWGDSGALPREFVTVTGERVIIYGAGIYAHDSLSVVAQGKASDLVTLILAVPALLISVWQCRSGSQKAALALVGILGYFLYTYVSYVFLWTYNPLFLVYVALMSASLFAFVLGLSGLDPDRIKQSFSRRLPVKFIGGLQWVIGGLLMLLWGSKILTALLNGQAPVGLEHYTTLVIQAMDLGLVVPVALVSGTLVMRRQAWGYLLSSVMLIKGFAMLIAITAMILNMALQQVAIDPIEVIIFVAFDVLMVSGLIVLFHHMNPQNISRNAS
jgi:hypothetical protein